MRSLVYLLMTFFWIWLGRKGLKYPWWVVCLGVLILSAYVILRPAGEWILIQVPIVD